MSLTPVQKITQAANKSEAAANVLEQIVEGDENTIVQTIGGRTHPSIEKWYKDSFLTMETFITSEADRSTTQANISTTQAGISTTQADISTIQAGNSAASAASASAWANNNEDVPVSVPNGGDGSTTFSSKHWAVKSQQLTVVVAQAEANVTALESSTEQSAVAANNSKNYAQEWANNDSSVPVSVAAGGNGVDTFSAKHWAATASTVSHTHGNKAILDQIASAGSGNIITIVERNKLGTIEENAKDDQSAAEVPFNNTVSGLVGSPTNVQTAIDLLDGVVDGIITTLTTTVRTNLASTISANTVWTDNNQVRVGTGSDGRFYHNGSSTFLDNMTGELLFRQLSNGQIIRIQAADNGGTIRDMITIDGDNSVNLNYAGSKKFETTSAGGLVTGVLETTSHMIVGGNLTVHGTTTTVNSNEVNIGDNIIVLNADEAGTPSQNSGFEVERGTSPNVAFLWNEATDTWSFGGHRAGYVATPTADFHIGDRAYNDGRYLGVNAKAADANLLDGLDSTAFARLSVQNSFTANQMVLGTGVDRYFRLGDTAYGANDYGYRLLYKGTGTGNNKSFAFVAENQTGSLVTVYETLQNGATDWKVAPTINNNAIWTVGNFNPNNYLGVNSIAVNSARLGNQLPAYYAIASHNHNATYLGINATAANSLLLNGLDSASFATASHNHSSLYLGINAIAVNSARLGNQLPAYYATAAHNHNATYLGINATAANSTQLGGIASSGYQRTGQSILMPNGVPMYFGIPQDLSIFTNGSGNAFIDLLSGTSNLYIIDNSGPIRFTFNENGNFSASGYILAQGNITAYSDETLKSHWSEFGDNFIEKMAAVKYGSFFRKDLQIWQDGVSAQSLQKILPNCVNADENGLLSVNYGNAALSSVVKLSQEIMILRAEIKSLKSNIGI